MRRRQPELADGALLDECDVLALQETYVRAGELNLPGFVAYHSATSCQQASSTAIVRVPIPHTRPAGRAHHSTCVLTSPRPWWAWTTCRAGFSSVRGGDFNSHHTAWGSSRDDDNGRRLLDVLLRAGLLAANTGSATFARRGCAGSAIDLSRVLERCHYIWRRSPDMRRSDHYPILLVPHTAAHLPTRSYSVVNWPRFRELCAAVPVSEGGLFRHIAECARAAATRCVVPAGEPVPDIKQLNLLAARRRAEHKASALDAVDAYIGGIGLTLSAAKTEALLEHPRYGGHLEIPCLSLRGAALPWRRRVRYLGLLIDHRLSWQPAVAALRKGSRQVAGAARSLMARGQGCYI
ncbi:hypothetical protein HPB49_002040 [Dermacentor silvarum]|uniref:Uncharacterized protein n=1 Tax=Dermacentor silvarum TaxID=543639 RepID=A0ACB8CCZ0_DERSI|nr:hypothetical protein HPB49_002040 [Dermacentor silvarum]